MPGIFPVVGSLDMVHLSEELADFLRIPSGKPFVSDVVIVDGKGTSNWLTHALVRGGKMQVQLNAQLLNSRRVGGWLASVIGTAELARLKGEEPQPVGHNAADHLAGLPTAIYDLLADEVALPAELDAWVKFRGEPQKDGGAVLWDLSQRIANHFRELLRNDPDWIEKVRQPSFAHDRWSALWSLVEARLRASLSRRLGLPPEEVMLHEVDVLRRLSISEQAVDAVRDALPGRIAMFSTGDVSTTLVRILMCLQGKVEVRLFHLEPSADYLKHIDKKRSAGAAFLDSSKKFFELQQDKLIRLLDKDGAGERAAVQPRSASLLASLQYSVSDFEDADFSHEGFQSERDGSVSIHRCHGVWREAEVLRDQLLKAFEENKELKQGDVLILSPDPEAFAPVLEAVLGQRAIKGPGKDGEIRGFGFATAGMYGIRRSPVGAMVDALLKLPKGRLTSLDVLNFLSLEAVQSHHGWDESQLEEIEKWFRDAPYHWGLDMSHRTAVVRTGLLAEATEEQPELIDLGTLEDFLRRLSLGTAFGEEIPIAPIAGEMPLRRVDGQQDMQLAAEIIRVLELIHAWVSFSTKAGHASESTLSLTRRKMVLDSASAESSYAEWDQSLGWLPAFKRVFNALRPQGAEYALECRSLFQSLGGLARRFSEGGAGDREVSYDLFLALMDEHCSFESSAGQFMSGNVTLAPLRSTSIHPAKVIALVGMNDGAFPRRSSGLGPEIYAGEDNVFARRAQECREDTSMHAFLLAVMAAQERLIVTFDGYLGADGAAANAAYPVEMLRRSLRKLTDGAFKVTGHAIMSYLPVGLAKGDVPARWTFDRESMEVSKLIGKVAFPVLSPAVIAEPKELTLSEWARFWESPPREALRRLGVRVPYQGKVLRVEEPLQADGPTEKLASDWVKEYVSQRRRHGPPKVITQEEVSPLAERSGMFPPGMAGQILLEQLLNEQNLGEAQIKEEIRTFVGRLLLRPDVSLEADPELSSERRLVYVHPDSSTLAVGVVERFYPDSEVIKWLCVLPKLAVERNIKLTRLFICGLKKPNDSDDPIAVGVTAEAEVSSAEEATEAENGTGESAEGPVVVAEIKVPLDKKLCDLEGADNTAILSKLEALVSLVVDAETPVMPRTMWAGVSGVMTKARKGRKARSQSTSADLLGGGGFSQSDAKDQRARVFIPEKFGFDEFNAAIDALLGCSEGATTHWKYYGFKQVNPYLNTIENVALAAAKKEKKAIRDREKEVEAAKKKEERELKKAADAAKKALSGKPSMKGKSKDNPNPTEPDAE